MIIFIDDLDRLLPEQAVGLLESLKLFLDISGCVFVVSCDRQVVAEGIKQKFKYDDPKGKGFFDKIIQVPLNMPKYGELAMDFCSKMLKILGIEENPPIESLKQYVDLINCSVGFNPRTVKRLFNNLLLSKLIIEKGRGDSLDSKKVSILFAALCLQETYPLIYNWILRSDTSNDSFQKVMKGKSPPVNEPELEKFIHLLKDSCFSKIFSNIIGNITVEELRILISPSAKIVSTSSSPGEESTEREESTEMTDTGEPEISYIERTRYHNRKLMNTVISEAESKYGKYLEKLSPLIETTGFEKYQPVLGFNDCYMLIYLKITPSKNKDLRFEIHHEAKFEEKQKYIRHFFRWWMDQKEENSKIHNWFKDHIHSIEYFKRLPTKVQVLNQFNECRVPLYDNLDLSVGTSREDFDKIFRETTFKILDELLPKLTEFYKDGKLK